MVYGLLVEGRPLLPVKFDEMLKQTYCERETAVRERLANVPT